MSFLDAVVLGIVEGLTEFLPVSSTGHLTIVEKWLGLDVAATDVTGFTAVIQMGAILAVICFFAKDIWRIALAWLRGLTQAEYRGTIDHRMGWYVIVGTIPIGAVGLLGKDFIKHDLRSLWVVAGALIVWSGVMVASERVGRRRRGEKEITMRDALVVGVVQCIALVPGVSRSGATIAAGLFRDLDRVAATRLSFFLSIPALLAAGAFELKDALGGSIHSDQLIVGTVVSFVVAYAAIAWLLRFVAHHSIAKFVPYRIALALVVIGMLASGLMTAT
jgi:undecaprenyl-diphosphatase